MSSINRDTAITYLGHATALIKTPTGKRILLDPWTKGNPACPEAFKPFESLGIIDFVLITHIHNDHAADAVEVLKANTDAFAVCVPEVCAWLGTKEISNLYPMNVGGSLHPAHSELTFSMTQAFHTSSFTEADGSIVNGGAPVGFVIELENGFTIYAAGDTSVFGDMSLIREIYNPDLALLPIGDNYTMGPRTAAVAMRLLGARYVIPIHFATFPALTGTPEALREYAAELTNSEIIVLKPGETVS